jgi:IS605 OrfB family transposase
VERHSAEGLTAAKRTQVRGLAATVSRERNKYIADYWPARHAASILTRSRRLADERRKKGWADNPLSAHFNRVTLLSALAILKGSWRAALASAQVEIFLDHGLTEHEKSWMRRVVANPLWLQLSLDGETPRLAHATAGLDERRLSRRVRQLVLRSRGSMPRTANDWFDVDTNLYRIFSRPEDRRFHGAWLALTTTTRGRRVQIPLAGPGLTEFAAHTDQANSKPGLRVEVRERICFRLAARVPITSDRGATEAGIDLGYRNLLTVSTGEVEGARTYGTQAHWEIREVVSARERRIKDKQRLQAYERSVRNTDARKAARIRRNNLGRTKSGRASRRERNRLKETIGRELNRLFAEHPEIGVIHAENLDFRRRRRPAPFNRLIRRWQHGYLTRHLALKAQLHGVRLNVVNPAWTSVTCPRCGYLSSENRRADLFECGPCGYAASADGVAATNILRRGSDRAITRFTSSLEAKRILEGRWRSALSGGAWGSPDRNDRDRSTSREQRSSLTSTAPVPLQPSPQ